MAFYFWPKWILKAHIINGIKKGIKCGYEYACMFVCARASQFNSFSPNLVYSTIDNTMIFTFYFPTLSRFFGIFSQPRMQNIQTQNTRTNENLKRNAFNIEHKNHIFLLFHKLEGQRESIAIGGGFEIA